MKNYLAFVTIIPLLFYCIFAGADAATKRQYFEKMEAAANSGQGDQPFFKTAANFLTEDDPRIPYEEKLKKSEALLKTIDLAQVKNKKWEIFDKTYTEEEAKYLASFLDNPVRKKSGTYQKEISDMMLEMGRGQMIRNYEKITGLKYVDYRTKPTPPPKIFSIANAPKEFEVCVESPQKADSEECVKVYRDYAMRFIKFPSPNWATKLVWKVFPDQKNSCDALVAMPTGTVEGSGKVDGSGKADPPPEKTKKQ